MFIVVITLFMFAKFWSYLCSRLGELNRTSSLSKSVLRYVLDKGQCFNLESVFTQSCLPNKESDCPRRVKQFVSFGDKDVLR